MRKREQECEHDTGKETWGTLECKCGNVNVSVPGMWTFLEHGRPCSCSWARKFRKMSISRKQNKSTPHDIDF
jgi:hypothetical protein